MVPNWRFFVSFACLTGVAASAQGYKGPDWKLFGFTKIDGKDVEVFFLKSDIRSLPNGNLLVWTKGLDVASVENALDPSDQAFIDKAADLIVTGYVPPYAEVSQISDDEKVTLISAEQIANKGVVVPLARILYEIDCSARMTRELSIEIVVNGKRSSKEKAAEWRHAAPETNGGSLVTLACPKR